MSCKLYAEVLNQLLRLTKYITMWLQQDALALLCDMADFSFYRPAIRKAEPGKMVAQTLFEGWSQVHTTASISHMQCCYHSALLPAIPVVSMTMPATMDWSGPDLTSAAVSVCIEGSHESSHLGWPIAKYSFAA